jgi:hypothetical protein
VGSLPLGGLGPDVTAPVVLNWSRASYYPVLALLAVVIGIPLLLGLLRGRRPGRRPARPG